MYPLNMNCEEMYEFCRCLPDAEEAFPFDNVTLVMKVHGKMFALIPLDNPDTVTVKCDPERAIELRERYSGINPAWHFNKRHWNMMDLNGSVPRSLLMELIIHSYNLVVSSLPRKLRDGLSLIDTTSIHCL